MEFWKNNKKDTNRKIVVKKSDQISQDVEALRNEVLSVIEEIGYTQAGKILSMHRQNVYQFVKLGSTIDKLIEIARKFEL